MPFLTEPDNKKYPYAGWIPSVNGRLSFRHIGESRHPANASYANVTIPATRYILAFQERRLSDHLFQFITHFLYDIEDRFYFVLCAKTTDPPERADQIEGTIHIYKSKDDWDALAATDISREITVLNDSRLAIAPNRDARIIAAYDKANSTLIKTSDIEVDFFLWRTGEIFFAGPVFAEDSLQEASVEYAHKQQQDFLKWVADQAYFFVRDISHRHQHHSPDSDTILILQKHEDDTSWRANILFSLHHYIIRAKRSYNTQTIHRCVGVLAYATSFRKTCNRFFKDDTVIPAFNEEELLASLNARISEHTYLITENANRDTLRLSRRAVGLALLAIVFAVVVMFVQPQIEKGEVPELRAASEFIAQNFRALAWGLFIAFLILWGSTSDRLLRARFTRDILEALSANRANAIFAILVIAASFLLTTLWLNSLAVSDLTKAISDLWGVR